MLDMLEPEYMTAKRIRVLVVDDSTFLRRTLSLILNADPRLEVVGTAENGAKAVELTLELQPDVITMDVEMPVMDGIGAIQRIMTTRPTPILMFSSLTTQGARTTLEALEYGAVDYLPKRYGIFSRKRDQVGCEICDKVVAIGGHGLPMRYRNPYLAPRLPRPLRNMTSGIRHSDFEVVLIGASTGGPMAVQELLIQLPKEFPVPLLLVQHMPASFTPLFAQRLNELCAIEVMEARHGELLRPGCAYLAPGGRHLELSHHGNETRIKLTEPQPGDNYVPSVDRSFTSAARFFPKKALAIVLTGMGTDGTLGAEELKRFGATLWAQDEQSCVVYGMPGSVTERGLVDKVFSLPDLGKLLIDTI